MNSLDAEDFRIQRHARVDARSPVARGHERGHLIVETLQADKLVNGRLAVDIARCLEIESWPSPSREDDVSTSRFRRVQVAAILAAVVAACGPVVHVSLPVTLITVRAAHRGPGSVNFSAARSNSSA